METWMANDRTTKPHRRRSAPGRCPVCGGKLEVRRPRYGTRVHWCQSYCWCRIEHPDGSVRESNLGLGDPLRWAG